MIIRRKHNGNFTVIPNNILNDDRLDYDAVGLLCYLLSKPDNWQVQVEHLRHRGGIGRDKAYRLIRLLRDAGYIAKQSVRDPDTQAFASHEFVVSDQPFPENTELAELGIEKEPLPEKPLPETPDTANEDHNKYGKIPRIENNKPRSGEQGVSVPASASKTRRRIKYTPNFEKFWKAYPTTRNMPKAEAFKQWQRLDATDQQAATDSLPAVKRDLSKEDWRRPVYAERYLKQRRFEGYSQTADVAELTELDWSRNCALAIKTGQWPRAWGPAPGKADCVVPVHLVTQQLIRALQGRKAFA